MKAVQAADRVNAALNKLSFIRDAVMDSDGGLSAESQAGLARIIVEIHQDLAEATDQLFTMAKQAGSAEANAA